MTWTSSDPSVATVSAGKVTAKEEGTTTITATTFNGYKYVLQKALKNNGKEETYIDTIDDKAYFCNCTVKHLIEMEWKDDELIHFTFPENINEYKIKFYKKEYVDDVECIKCSLEDSNKIIYYYINLDNYNIEKEITIDDNVRFEYIYDYGNVKKIEKFDFEKYKDFKVF